MNTLNTIIAPASEYLFSHCHINPKTGTTGTRWDYVNHEGLDRPELYKVLKRKPDTGKKVIYLNKYTGNHDADCPTQALFADNPISGLHEPDTSRPGYGWGDIRGTEDAILAIRDMEAGTLKIMVFPGMKKQQIQLFQNWATGGVSESIPNNKAFLPTDSVQNISK